MACGHIALMLAAWGH